MNPIPTPTRQNGFTLLEVLMAATLLAVMMTLLLGSLRIGARSWEEGDRRTAATSRMLAAGNFLRTHLATALPLPNINRRNTAQDEEMVPLMFQGSADRLKYVGTLPPQVRGGLYLFELYIAERNDGRDLKLAMMPLSSEDNAGFGGANREGIEDVTIVENLDTFRIAYLEPPTPDAAPTWRTEWRERMLPALIRLEITPTGEAPWPALVIVPRIEGRK